VQSYYNSQAAVAASEDLLFVHHPQHQQYPPRGHPSNFNSSEYYSAVVAAKSAAAMATATASTLYSNGGAIRPLGDDAEDDLQQVRPINRSVSEKLPPRAKLVDANSIEQLKWQRHTTKE
jgi:hypothetical protein